MSLSSIRTYLSKSNRATWCIFVLFVTMIFTKCILFHWWYYHTIVISSIWTQPLEAFLFYLPKFLVAILLGSIIFITKRKWWTIIILLLIDTWCIANLMYHNANNLLLDVPAIMMATNLQGFESSLSAYFQYSYLLFIALTALYAASLTIVRNDNKWTPKWFIVFFCIVVSANLCLCIPNWLGYYHNRLATDFDMANGQELATEYNGKFGWHLFIPFHEVKMDALPNLTYNPNYGSQYVYHNSILHYAAAMIVFHINTIQPLAANINPKDIQPFVSERHSFPTPQQNLIFILVESMESWPFYMGEDSWKIAPNFMDVLSRSNTIQYPFIRSQAMHGVSGDGQMIVTTGLLPINSGAACMICDDNVWPSYVSLYPHSAFIDIAKGVWNQRTMCKQYGYISDIYSVNESNWSDKDVFEQLNHVLDTIGEPYCTMVLTGAMHSPFTNHHGYQLDITNDFPKLVVDYLECLHYTDSCFGIFWNNFKNSNLSATTSVLITGDHNVFKESTYTDHETFCPLFICTPNCEYNAQITDTCYQMDIYPTIMHLIGCEDYYWKGFGVNLFDSAALHNRLITEQEAYRLSDLMIRSNYFHRYTR